VEYWSVFTAQPPKLSTSSCLMFATIAAEFAASGTVVGSLVFHGPQAANPLVGGGFGYPLPPASAGPDPARPSVTTSGTAATNAARLAIPVLRIVAQPSP